MSKVKVEDLPVIEDLSDSEKEKLRGGGTLGSKIDGFNESKHELYDSFDSTNDKKELGDL